MRRTELLTMFDYLGWLREQVLSAAGELSSDEFAAPQTVTARDLRATLVHTVDVEATWRTRLTTAASDPGAHPAELDPLAFPTAEAVGTLWRREAAETRRWLAGLTDEELAADSPLEGLADVPLAAYPLQVVIHGIQECEDATVLLRRAGHAPGAIGFLGFWDPHVAGRRDGDA